MNNRKKLFKNICLAVVLLFTLQLSYSQQVNNSSALMVGVAETEITPPFPIRLAGYAIREKNESAGTLMPLRAKALAFGNSYNNTSVIITADLIGITSEITNKVREKLRMFIKPENLTIAVSHTHGGPEIGSLLNILQYTSPTTHFSNELLPDSQIININYYRDILINMLADVAVSALKKRELSYIYYGVGNVDFARNRRGMPELTDYDLPVMKITDTKGKLKAVLLSYACHAVCLDYNNNYFHGDWVGDAQLEIEKKHPGALALIAVGCAGDQNPTRITGVDNIDLSKLYGSKIANAVDSMLHTHLLQIKNLPKIKQKKIFLPYKHVPDTKELAEWTKDKSVKGYYATLALDRIARGEQLPKGLPYTIQTWKFGDDLDIVFLAGEVVVEYALRLKKELGNKNLWVVAYANDVPCYIASERMLKTNVYETEASMYYYNKPSRFEERIEDLIIRTVHSLVK